MELALPLLALGGFYVISNQESRQTSNNSSSRKVRFKEQEGFQNVKPVYNTNQLPNVDPPVQNYPTINHKDLVDTVAKYENSNNASSKYFDQNTYENLQDASGKNVGNTIQQMYSLTGNYVDKSNFKHNNMVPFYGGKIKGQLYGANMAETILDNMVGSGSQVIKKIEQAPLFKPQENMQWANGAPNMSDFYQSRVNPGMKSNNVKPFDSVNVGPGLNQGYTNTGSGGFNSGMEARNDWLPKTVDELRVSTNPKLEYSLENHEGPSYSTVKNVGILGKVEKFHPDTFYIQTQDRWLTTTGQEKGQMLQPIQEVYDTARVQTTSAYSGVAGGEKNATYVSSAYEQPKRAELAACDVGHSTAAKRGPSDDSENFQKSHTNHLTKRSLSRQPDTMRSGFGRTIGAVIAPLMDVIKPTRKEEYSANVRIYGDAGSRVSDGYTPMNPVATTVKETTIYSPNSYIGNQTNAAYIVSEQQAITNQRDSTNYASVGNPGGNSSKWGDVNMEQYANQINNESKEKSVVSRSNHGNTQIYNQTMNVNVAKIDCDRNNNRLWAPTMIGNGTAPFPKEMYGAIRQPQQYNSGIEVDRISGDLLQAFKNNPYTHSLTDCV
jgi:hypothetical protein